MCSGLDSDQYNSEIHLDIRENQEYTIILVSCKLHSTIMVLQKFHFRFKYNILDIFGFSECLDF